MRTALAASTGEASPLAHAGTHEKQPAELYPVAAGTTNSVLEDLRSLLMARYPHRILDNRSLNAAALEGTQTVGSGTAAGRGGADFTGCRQKKKALPTGIGAWDRAAGGLRLGEVTEVCGALGGTSLLMDQLLEATKAAGWFGAWVDGGDSLEVEDWDPEALGRIVWMRCRDPDMALKGADLLLRDGNLSWVTLDLQAVSAKALRRISGQHWHRFHRLVEHRGNALLVLTPSPMVEGAKVRVLSRASMNLESLHQPRSELQTSTVFEVFLKGFQPNGMSIPKKHTPSLLQLPKSA